MAKRDYYEILGLSREASQDDIKQAYRRLARKYHPDVNPDDPRAEEKFKELKEAYDILSDPDNRARYDRFGHQAFQEAGSGYRSGPDFGPQGPGFGDFQDMGDLDDIFEMFFGGGFGGRTRGRSRTSPRRGADLRYDLRITLEDVARGLEKELEMTRTEQCEECEGSGAAAGSAPANCDACGGTGQVRQARRTPLGQMVNVTTCRTCGGAGTIITSPCGVCGGEGRRRRRRKINIQVPAGVEDGTRLRLNGEGEAGSRGGPPGDLYVYVSVQPHSSFTRDGPDVYCDTRISMTQAVLGTEIEVPTLYGEARLNIPPGTQPGKRFRMRGQGLPRLRGQGHGDQLVRVNVEIPERLNQQQRKLLEELATSFGEEPRREEGLFQRVRDAFSPG